MEVATALLNGQTYIKTSLTSCHFTKTDLQRMSNHFTIPSAGKLYNLLKNHYHSAKTKTIKGRLYKIPDHCEQCSEYTTPPFLFRTSIHKENIVFNRKLCMDLMWLSTKPAPHTVATETGFQTAIFIKDKSAESLWYGFVTFWAPIYNGFLDTIKHDRETVFTFNEFHNNAENFGIEFE